MKVCIIGGVAGGASAAARLRRLNEEAEIIMFERGEFISFANCGLPYHISGKIKDRSSLVLQTPVDFKNRFNVDVRVFNEVLKIDRANKKIEVKNLKSGEVYFENYDKLILSPGAAPFLPPIKGVDSEIFVNLRNIPDLDRILEILKNKSVKDVVVIGGGFIGIEVAENLAELGIRVHIVELLDQVLAYLDKEMANIVHAKLVEQGITLHLSNGIKEISGSGVVLNSGERLDAQMVVGAIGVRPEVKLAKEADLKLGSRGGISVSANMQTNDNDIYAVGDAVEVKHFVTESDELYPLAGPANKQGRIAADNICGIGSLYKKTQGTGIVKVFNLQVASTGINEKMAKAKGIQYKAIHIHPNNHAGYYPDAFQNSFKAIFDRENGKILGAQGIGLEGVDKRIDVIATAIRAGMTVFDLEELELSYAPPFGSAKDPVNMIGFVGSNIIKGLVQSVTWDQVEGLGDVTILDVRTKSETTFGTIPGAKTIPVDNLRDRISELDKNKKIVISCQVGIRAYIAYRILKQRGFSELYNLSGGFKTYKNYIGFERDSKILKKNNGISLESSNVEKLDLCGLQCPGPIMQLNKKISSMEVGERILAQATDPGFVSDLPAFCESTGNQLLSTSIENNRYCALIQKGGVDTSLLKSTCSSSNKKSLIVFSNDLDKALATFIIANGARAMGSEVSLFFTFWGLNILRKEKYVKVNKNIIERMFGMMMPKGPNKLSLSKMHMMGMGTGMMKYVMKNKNVSTLESLVKSAQESGIKLIACAMTMDIMGIKAEELIEGVEVGGVAQYLHNAESCNLNLFI